MEEKVGEGLWKGRGRGGGDWCIGEERAGRVRASRAEIEQGQGYGKAGTSKMDGIKKKKAGAEVGGQKWK